MDACRRVLLVHPRPAPSATQLAMTLAGRGDDVTLITERPEARLAGAGVRPVPMAAAVTVPTGGHRYLWELDRAVRTGQRAYRAARTLATEGYAPDVIIGRADDGATLYLAELFPAARLVCDVDWYHRPRGSDGDFFPDRPLDVDSACRRRARNATVLLQLAQCDRAVVASEWQLAQFPRDALAVLSLLRTGLDTTFWSPPPPPAPPAPPTAPPAEGLITFVADSLDPYRGIGTFLRAAATVVRRRPGTPVVVIGRDDVPGAWPAPDAGGSWPRSLMSGHGLDPSQIRLLGDVGDLRRRDLLRRSRAHVHLNAPFTPADDLLEAMAVGALVVGSRTPPVEEVLVHGRNGLLVDFDDAEGLADTLLDALVSPHVHDDLRRAARRDVARDHDLDAALAARCRLLDDVVADRPAATVEGSVAGRLLLP